MPENKQVILIRMDLKLPRGKACAQIAHAAVESAFKSNKKLIREWLSEGAKKVVLKVKDDNELRSFQQKANEAGLITALITDAGLTIVPPGTITCLAIGPDNETKIDGITGELKLL